MQLQASREQVWNVEASATIDGIELENVYFAADPTFQVATARARTTPNTSQMRALRDLRQGRKLMSLAVAVLVGDEAALLAPGEEQPVFARIDIVQSALQVSLEQPTEIEAAERLREIVSAIRSQDESDGGGRGGGDSSDV